MCFRYLLSLEDDYLCDIFSKVLSHLLRCQGCVFLSIEHMDRMNYVATLDRIYQILTMRGWIVERIMPESANFSFFQQSRQTLYAQQPQLCIEYHQVAATTQEIVVHQQRGRSISQQASSPVQDNHSRFLERHEKEQEKNEKMLGRYKEEEARRQKEELDREYHAAEREKEASIRKLKAAEEAAERDRKNEVDKGHKQRKIDELRREKGEFDRKIRDQKYQSEQDKRDAARRREEEVERQRREADARREEEERQRQTDYERKRTYETQRSVSDYREYRDSITQRELEDERRKRETAERQLREERERKEEAQRSIYIQDRHVETTQLTVSHNEQTSISTSRPNPNIANSEASDSDSDSSSDSSPRRDPYKLLGLLDRATTPLIDIKATHNALIAIHDEKLATSSISAADKKNSERRLVEIKWAGGILLDELNKRAFDEEGAVFEHEQSAWRKKSKFEKKKCL